jgi:hypothetical protein
MFEGTFLTGLSTAFEKEAGGIGKIFSIGGALTGAIGGFFQAQTQQNQLKSQAMSLEFQSKMAEINARQAEFGAQGIAQAGERQAGAVSMKSGLVKGAARASLAARGVQLGEGSAAELIGTNDLMKEIDMLTINSNTVRAAENARTQSVNYQNQASLLSVSSHNVYASANSISPMAAGFTSLLGSASSIGNSWFMSKQMANMQSLLVAQSGGTASPTAKQ